MDSQKVNEAATFFIPRKLQRVIIFLTKCLFVTVSISLNASGNSLQEVTECDKLASVEWDVHSQHEAQEDIDYERAEIVCKKVFLDTESGDKAENLVRARTAFQLANIYYSYVDFKQANSYLNVSLELGYEPAKSLLGVFKAAWAEQFDLSLEEGSKELIRANYEYIDYLLKIEDSKKELIISYVDQAETLLKHINEYPTTDKKDLEKFSDDAVHMSRLVIEEIDIALNIRINALTGLVTSSLLKFIISEKADLVELIESLTFSLENIRKHKPKIENLNFSSLQDFIDQGIEELDPLLELITITDLIIFEDTYYALVLEEAGRNEHILKVFSSYIKERKKWEGTFSEMYNFAPLINFTPFIGYKTLDLEKYRTKIRTIKKDTFFNDLISNQDLDWFFKISERSSWFSHFMEIASQAPCRGVGCTLEYFSNSFLASAFESGIIEEILENSLYLDQDRKDINIIKGLFLMRVSEAFSYDDEHYEEFEYFQNKAISFLNRLQKPPEDSLYRYHVYNTYLENAQYNYYLGSTSEALRSSSRALQMALDESAYLESEIIYAESLLDLDFNKKALISFDNIIKRSKENNYFHKEELLTRSFMGKATTHAMNEEFLQARNLILDAIEIQKSIEFDEFKSYDLAEMYSKLGQVESRLFIETDADSHLDLAEKAYQKGIEYLQKFPPIFDEGRALAEIRSDFADVLNLTKKLEEGVKLLNKAKEDFPEVVSSPNWNMSFSQIEQSKGNFEEAFRYAKEASKGFADRADIFFIEDDLGPDTDLNSPFIRTIYTQIFSSAYELLLKDDWSYFSLSLEEREEMESALLSNKVALLTKNFTEDELTSTRVELERYEDRLKKLKTRYLQEDKMSEIKEKAIQLKIQQTIKKLSQLKSKLKAQIAQFKRTLDFNKGKPGKVGNISNEEALLVYYLDQDEGFVWVITDEEEAMVYLDEGNKNIVNLIDNIRPELGRHFDLDSFDFESAYLLYQILISPIEDIIKNKKSLHIVPHASLSSLPFEMIVSSLVNKTEKANWLIRDFSFSYLPEFWLHRNFYSNHEIKKRSIRKEQKFLGIANPIIAETENTSSLSDLFVKRGSRNDFFMKLPSLPNAEKEIREISDSFSPENTLLLTQKEASEETLLSTNIASFDVIVFATHAINENLKLGIEESALVLTQLDTNIDFDGLLYASEISKFNLNAEWVILSACNTASLSDRTSSGVARDLPSAFLNAGAQSLLLSHWELDDFAARFITTNLFKELENPDVTKSDALRSAKLKFLDHQGGSYSHPIYWAPLTLVGSSLN